MTSIGVDLGGTKLLAVRVDGSTIVEQRATPAGPGDDLAALAVDAIRAVWSDDVTAVGAGIAGMVSWPEGVFVWGPHVAGTDVPLRATLESTFGVPAVVDNDANCALWGEARLGAAAGYDNALLVTLGTGIGGALLISGEVYRGNSFAGEIGHMSHEAGRFQCACGKTGCWETVASGPALVRLATAAIADNPESSLAHRLGGQKITGENITRAADAGDEIARSLVAQVGRELGLGLCSLIAVLDPEVVVVGGGLGSVGESLLGPARRAAADALHGGSHRMLPPILVASLGAAAGAVGAAILARDAASGRVELVGESA